MHYILAVNPGSTSTKVAVYEDEKELFTDSISYSFHELEQYPTILDQLGMRLDFAEKCLERSGIRREQLSAVVGRGGILPPVKTGGYLINEKMKEHLKYHAAMQHACNLGALIAAAIAEPLGIPSYIYDAATADELPEIAKLTGFPEIKRQSICHVLNSRAVAIKAAKKAGKTYENMNYIVAHIGGGISISAHKKGHLVDSVADDGGPFAPDRSGSVNLMYLIDLCYSGLYTKTQILKKVRGAGGMKAHLGTHDCREIEKMIAEGDEYANLVYQAQAYQIAKGIGVMTGVFDEPIHAIILTGGMAHSKLMTDMIISRIRYLAPVEIFPGEFEMEALAHGALRLLKKEEVTHEF